MNWLKKLFKFFLCCFKELERPDNGKPAMDRQPCK